MAKARFGKSATCYIAATSISGYIGVQQIAVADPSLWFLISKSAFCYIAALDLAGASAGNMKLLQIIFILILVPFFIHVVLLL